MSTKDSNTTSWLLKSLKILLTATLLAGYHSKTQLIFHKTERHDYEYQRFKYYFLAVEVAEDPAYCHPAGFIPSRLRII